MYELIFKLPESNVFMTDMLVPAYSTFYPIVTIKNGKWEFLMSEENLRKIAQAGYEFALSEDKYREQESKYPIFLEKIKKIKKIKIKELDNKNFITFLIEFKLLFSDFFNTYKETEFIYFAKIEKVVQEYIEDKHSFDEVLSGEADLTTWPPEYRKLADYLINMQHLKLKFREMITEVALGENSLFIQSLQESIKRTKRVDAHSMTVEEITRLLLGKEVKDVSERQVYSYITFDKNNLNIISGGEAYKKIRLLDKDIPKNQVIGTSACKGVVKGRVKIIPTSQTPEKYLNKMEKGDILVSDTTGPDLMTAIKKAAAIVTDEGGMMSHAAVISREFGIPCIVGTKYATEVFKDNDLIEVNADIGIAKKI
ncbi:MAG: PEP-utilizing enzyme [archaeon]